MPSSDTVEKLRHDIKNPLTSALISCECALGLLRKFDFVRVNVDKVADFLDDIQDALGYIKDVVDNDGYELKEFSVVEEVGKSVRAIGSKGIDIVVDCADNIKLYGNLSKFRRVMINLLVNAVESFMELDASNNVAVIVKNPSGRFVTVVIQDNGVGIPFKNLNKIFENGYSSKIGNSSENRGLGLYICKTIIEKDFDGSISVVSKTGKNHGTKFTLSFPHGPSRGYPRFRVTP